MSNYVPPGVEIHEAVAPPQVSPILASPSDVVLVGPSQGYQTYQERVTLTTPGQQVKLPFLAALNANVPNSASLIAVASVTNYVTPGPEPYKFSTDYTVNLSAGSLGIAPSESSIPNNTVVYVTYTWIPSTYFFPKRYESIGEISQVYGTALDPTGTKINSPLTFAASLCLSNGSGSVILQPLFINETDPPGPTTPKLNPTSTQVGQTTAWSDTLSLLQGFVQNVDFIVPVVGQSLEHVGNAAQLEIYQQIQKFLVAMNQEDIFAIGIFGDDSSANSSVGQEETLWANAATLKSSYGGTLNQQMVYINTSNFQVALPSSSATTPTNFLSVGGQYMASALAGAFAGRPLSASMTRQAVSGFTAVLDQRTKAAKNVDAGNGLLVMEQVGPVVRCRHAITLDSSSVARNEVSVVRAKFNLIASLKETLENQIIGKIIADANSPFVVRSAIVGVLSALQSKGAILDYSQVVCAIASINPTKITAVFSYRPAFTVNYVEVQFSLDLSAQTITLESTKTIIGQ